ncbi:class I SAM-dependent methyltransferase [Lysinibacillus sp. NPDC097162]|uniref:class I SAM-dependent methyltransferase n=1 Tax=Lysinibacillus sp. NPDC097162 TaxID=3364140 RepID=UPI00382EF36D
MTNQPIVCSFPKLNVDMIKENWYEDYFNEDYWNLVYYSCSSIEITENELSFIKSILEESNASTVLDLFCGIGRHANRLSEEGYIVTGLDIDPNSIKIAESSSESHVDYIVSDARDFTTNNKYDCCLLMQTSFGYFSDLENQKLITKIYSLLNENGILIIDIPNRDNMLKNFRYRDWVTIEDTTYVISHQFDYINSRRNTSMKVIDKQGQREQTHSIRMYSISEMIAILENSNFVVQKLFGDFTLSNVRFNNDYKRLQLVAQKVGGVFDFK